MGGKKFTRVRHIVVAKRDDRAAGQLRAGIDACMRQLIEQNQSITPDQHRNNPRVRQIAGPKNTGSFRAFELSEAGFQFCIERVIAGDQPRGTRAGSVFLNRCDRRLFDGRMLGEVQVVVARKGK